MIFETERLTIRHLSENDLEGFHDLQSNPRVMKYTSGRAMPLEDNKAELLQLIQAYEKPDNPLRVWAIEQKGDSVFVGTCALIFNKNGETEIGYRIREQCWGKGYGTEVAGQLIRFAFENSSITSLCAYVYTANHASVKILERHMRLEKEFYNEEAKAMDRKYVLTGEDYAGLSL